MSATRTGAPQHLEARRFASAAQKEIETMPKHTATLQEAMPHLRALYRVLFTENEAARRLHRATKAAEARLAEPKSRTR